MRGKGQSNLHELQKLPLLRQKIQWRYKLLSLPPRQQVLPYSMLSAHFCSVHVRFSVLSVSGACVCPLIWPCSR